MGFSNRIGIVVLVFTLIGLFPSAGICSIACDVSMYRNGEPDRPTDRFAPEDRITVRVKFIRLPEGRYTFQADWYNSLGELQDASNSSFTVDTVKDVVSESWLELMKAGLFRRIFSTSENTGYNIKFYGTWTVKLFLNGKEITSRKFKIQ